MTNFLSEQDFERFLNSLRQLLESNQKSLGQTNRQLSMPIEGFEELFKLAYGSALRISETLSLTSNDLDFDKRILTLNNTKTGFKKCPKCKGSGQKKFDDYEGKDAFVTDHPCNNCAGSGRIRKPQYTTLHPKYLHDLDRYSGAFPMEKPLFKTNRFTLWSYAKQAGKLAGLNVFEQQDERLIEGVWTHLFRKSRAQQMMLDKSEDEASEYVFELVKIKLRHSAKARDVTFRYTNKIGQKLGLNELLEWEKKHYG